MSADLVYLSRKIYMSCAHRYYQKNWSEEQNKEVFGACSNPFGHGHNYEVEVTLKGPVDQNTGMVINLTDLDAILKTRVMDILDHRFLDREIPWFFEHIPTTENIAVFIWEQICKEFASPIFLFRIKVMESHDLFVEYYGETSP